MLRRIVVPALAVMALTCVSLTADAQTGPIGGGGGSKGGKGPQIQPGQGQGLTAERVVSIFQAKGANATLNNTQNGKTVRVILEAGGWKYDFDVIFVNYQNGATQWFISSPLNGNARNFNTSQMAALMRKNFDLNGQAIFGMDNNGMLYLDTPQYATNVNDQVFEQLVTNYLNNVRGTVDLWNVQS